MLTIVGYVADRVPESQRIAQKHQIEHCKTWMTKNAVATTTPGIIGAGVPATCLPNRRKLKNHCVVLTFQGSKMAENAFDR